MVNPDEEQGMKKKRETKLVSHSVIIFSESGRLSLRLKTNLSDPSVSCI